MFTPTEYELLSLPYFNTVSRDPDRYEVQSKNTGHFWALIPDRGGIRLLHKYREKDRYHLQTYCYDVLSTVLEIISHDDYILCQKNPLFEELVNKYDYSTSSPLVS